MATKARTVPLEDDPLWYKDAIIYELHVRAFRDSNDDGIGDFRGLTEKLDYLQDLGITAIWLLPFYPSPLKDDGYDIADYGSVNPSYGDIQDFKRFMKEAHRRGIRVITELVINHTSDQHPWFRAARNAPPGSREREFYVWSDSPEKWQDARIIFQDFEHSNWSWDHKAHAYYWHRFYSHQPDLNFENPEVIKAIKGALDFWMDMGVDGMRLDAIPYLFEREGTNCENLPETHEVLKELRRHLDAKYQNRMFLAEANQWPEDAAQYFGEGDECHMNFHFPLMPRLFMAARMEDRFPIIDILEQTPDIPDNTQWAIFLRNPDELTLEMVTDEERDYMYRVYAHDRQARINLGIRRRLAPLLENNRRKIELMNGLLFSLPGTPVLYYGDEIGMGDNFYLGDRNGVRTPMQWSGDRNAGFSRANPQRLFLPVIIDPEYSFESVNVETQQANPSSLLWWMKRLIALRKQYRAFSRGELEFLYPSNRKVLAFIRRHEDEHVLVVANLSRFTQAVELDLSEFRGRAPVELFGRTEFPPIGELPYFLTLGPHSFHWFALETEGARSEGALQARPPEEIPQLAGGARWDGLLGERATVLERVLPSWLVGRRWFQAKARRIRSVTVDEVVPVGDGDDARLVMVDVAYAEGSSERYLVPMAFSTGEAADRIQEADPRSVIARVRLSDDEEGLLHDALADEGFAVRLLELLRGRRRLRGDQGEVAGVSFPGLRVAPDARLDPRVSRAEQSNTSVIYGDRFILKLYRRLDEGQSLDLELGRALAEAGFEQTPEVLGALEYRGGGGVAITLGLLQGYVPNEGDAWDLTLDALGEFFERALARRDPVPRLDASAGGLLQLAEAGAPEAEAELVGRYLDHAWLLGRRTAEMHVSLASRVEDPDFAPEAFSTLYQRSLYQSMRNLLGQTFQLMEGAADQVPQELRGLSRTLLGQREGILAQLRGVVGEKMEAVRIRVHGDYHLGQVLFTGKDFVITDFEGEPLRPLSERRLKRSPLRDVAGMIRSFHYAAYAALEHGAAEGGMRDEDVEKLEPAAAFWYTWSAATFLRAYLSVAAPAGLVPSDRAQMETLLRSFLVEKAVYELAYELNNRPGWLGIPLRGLSELVLA
ncbi:MAG TPA: maltose alpha-D-glucosyltransferase [Longimicrobiales bacterium]|nr:maltose alpha-D-glucosyltransferase [Longimicrobiales bacterium]